MIQKEMSLQHRFKKVTSIIFPWQSIKELSTKSLSGNIEKNTHMFTIRSEDYINGWRLPTEETKRLRTFKFG